jgi:hypothetical protein
MGWSPYSRMASGRGSRCLLVLLCLLGCGPQRGVKPASSDIAVPLPPLQSLRLLPFCHNMAPAPHALHGPPSSDTAVPLPPAQS